MKRYAMPQLAKRGETPANVRQQRTQAMLRQSGGRRIAVNLQADAASDLDHIKERDGLNSTSAIAAALRRHAKR